MPELREVVVYSRKGCHLCEIMKEKLVKLERRGGFRWREVDVETEDGLRRQFTDEVPVVFIDGRKAFKYRLDEQEFLKKLVGLNWANLATGSACPHKNASFPLLPASKNKR